MKNNPRRLKKFPSSRGIMRYPGTYTNVLDLRNRFGERRYERRAAGNIVRIG